MSEAAERRESRRARIAELRAEVEAIRARARLDQRAREADAEQRRAEAIARAASVADFLSEECREPRRVREALAAQDRAHEAETRRREIAEALAQQRLGRRRESRDAAQLRRDRSAARRRSLATFRRQSSARTRLLCSKARQRRHDALCTIYTWVERASGRRRRAPCSDCRGDKLRLIEGIGPKCGDLLRDSGVTTFRQLASSSIDSLRTILDGGGPRFRSIDPSTWPEQATLAAAGDMKGLRRLQRELVGGRRRDG